MKTFTIFTIKQFSYPLYLKFKSKCAERGITMKQALINLMKEFIVKKEDHN